ncbi:hypothetical protein [Geobacillus phage TP-84]|uniref:Uncharacterized protein n=1 Tax=Geobacillus phage TP-84 TaxID=1965361 RepID=A0A1U9WQR9_9CAUD|nr:hypothetical protein MUK65_gp04 [Geobacillus phage TP-84]AQY55102.1 hypothetical protein [Geobacillus phage TP-84]
MKKWIIGAAIGTLIGYMAGKLISKLDNMDKRIRQIEEEIESDDGWIDAVETDDDIAVKYPPKMAFICPKCTALVMFHGTDEAAQQEIEAWRQYEFIYCPYCDEEIEIDDWTRHILDQ